MVQKVTYQFVKLQFTDIVISNTSKLIYEKFEKLNIPVTTANMAVSIEVFIKIAIETW